tara:strand:+ start:596 stop:898 length:303 start_codon:yes stop_codon:yes gene_type:complete
MSIRPTTRLGYRYSVRPHKWRLKELLDNRDETNVEKFLRSREPRRMAGTKINAELIRSGSAPTPYIKGDSDLRRDEDDIDLISDNLDPDDLDEAKNREYS